MDQWAAWITKWSPNLKLHSVRHSMLGANPCHFRLLSILTNFLLIGPGKLHCRYAEKSYHSRSFQDHQFTCQKKKSEQDAVLTLKDNTLADNLTEYKLHIFMFSPFWFFSTLWLYYAESFLSKKLFNHSHLIHTWRHVSLIYRYIWRHAEYTCHTTAPLVLKSVTLNGPYYRVCILYRIKSEGIDT